MMKYVSLALATFAFSAVASATGLPEFNDANDTEAVIAISDAAVLSNGDGRNCRPTTEWTCFARDARGGALGVSTSFTRRDLAAGRAIASCKRKSSIPATCQITRCRQPEPECDGDHHGN